ncbi:hypothetical protein [Nocardiopsis baichengensis]|uniref:hypothetical protein n=1 Tax=Nocardiopsis baichengensis TaxID=280240 RepID=UPI0003806786|nr:hypothetical protein [Nocardiopsis baichengensis]
MPASRPTRPPVLLRAARVLFLVSGLATVAYRYGGTALSELSTTALVVLVTVGLVLGAFVCLAFIVWPSESTHRKEVIELLLTRNKGSS